MFFILFLGGSMDKQGYLLNLIERMLDETLEVVQESKGMMNITSSQAYHEVQALHDLSLVEPLKNLIARFSTHKKMDKNIRKKAYFIMEKIAVNTNNSDIFEYFADRLSMETDKDVISDNLLFYIERNEYTPNIAKVIPMLSDKHWQVRSRAISILGYYPKREVEDVLLAALRQTKDSYEISKILGALRRIGSTRVIKEIDKFLKHEKGEVRASAIATLKVVGGSEYIPVFVRGMKDKSRDVKLNALYAILETGGENEIGVLINRLKTIMKSQRNHEPATADDSDVVKILNFLKPYKQNHEVSLLLKWIRDNKWDNLFEHEKKWVDANYGVNE
jgi:hypothetical protein